MVEFKLLRFLLQQIARGNYFIDVKIITEHGVTKIPYKITSLFKVANEFTVQINYKQLAYFYYGLCFLCRAKHFSIERTKKYFRETMRVDIPTPMPRWVKLKDVQLDNASLSVLAPPLYRLLQWVNGVAGARASTGHMPIVLNFWSRFIWLDSREPMQVVRFNEDTEFVVINTIYKLCMLSTTEFARTNKDKNFQLFDINDIIPFMLLICEHT